MAHFSREDALRRRLLGFRQVAAAQQAQQRGHAETVHAPEAARQLIGVAAALDDQRPINEPDRRGA